MENCRWISLDELVDRRAEWRELGAASGFPSAYTDPSWILAWWRHYGGNHEPWSLALEDRSGSLRGLALLARGQSQLARALTFAGGRWNGLETLLWSPGAEAELTSSLLEALAERRREWDAWHVQRLPMGSTLARTLVNRSGALRAAARGVRYQPYLALPGSVEEFEARFVEKHHKDQRRKWRRLADLGARARPVTDPDEIEPALRALLDLRRQRAVALGQRHEHLDARFERFILTAVRGMAPERVRLWTMEVRGQPLALILNLVQGPREHGLLMGLGDAHMKLGPGNALQHHAIVEAIAEGRKELELGPGQDAYKYRLGAVDRRMLRARVLSPSLQGRINGVIAAIDLNLRNTGAADLLRRWRGLTPAQEKSSASGNEQQPASEEPAPEEPAPEKPAPEKPAPEKPAPEKPAPEKPVDGR